MKEFCRITRRRTLILSHYILQQVTLKPEGFALTAKARSLSHTTLAQSEVLYAKAKKNMGKVKPEVIEIHSK